MNIKREDDVIKARDEQILSWFKLPIKEPYKDMRLGPIACDMCGGGLYKVRSVYPGDAPRLICPTCAIEILGSIVANLHPNNQEMAEKLHDHK